MPGWHVGRRGAAAPWERGRVGEGEGEGGRGGEGELGRRHGGKMGRGTRVRREKGRGKINPNYAYLYMESFIRPSRV